MITPETRLPSWLRRTLPVFSAEKTHEILSRQKLNTVCESAKCPNRNECYSHQTATFMILGNTCTRSCRFCNVATGKGEVLQPDEPKRVAQAAKELGLKYVVVTSVARDDLKDEGAAHFAETVLSIRSEIPGVQIEVLTPDFHARRELISQIVAAKPEVYNHNLETVRRLTSEVRVQAKYDRSLQMLKLIKELDPQMTTKSGLMLGLGEIETEIDEACADLLNVGVNILTLGQYLRPSVDHLPVQEYVHPDTFSRLAKKYETLGFKKVFAGPYVRSSYHAGETFSQSLLSVDAEGAVHEHGISTTGEVK